MSDDADAKTTEPPKSATGKFYDDLTQATDYFAAPDRKLQELAWSAAYGASGAGIPVTLFLQGGMIAGHIASEQDFYLAMGEAYRDAYANATDNGELPQFADEFAKTTFDSVAEDTDKAIEDDDKAFKEHGTKNARRILTRQIYLRDAYYTVPGAGTTPHGFVCIRLSEVTGWTFGVTSWRS
ncbi:hypothetical protein [Mycobacteroides abscessus]|uniref:hypothetical protein n=1 Tax=Mycobacteroides abscessus TaxID=36809 RepID=UPI000928F8B1|nr:hypothetical protein [Mycobacteroides abscessus]QSM04889.1 hypothetical protein PROPHIGD91-4_38 [Mycobacterium phage prophi91-4]MDO3335136.1 hypothetical protein [Mycobacteroides abscessus subsp. bolletii]QSM87828.1 hypothetical protein I3U44_18700 [Mycobacteroides abscessus subsp. bolletii]SIB01256.1 Uncharacterised protein [Mycobacteroides abscessus subsp. bolletii]SII69818.1 Uncharacterised protein [Mycobacteroides abscessus subsp. bolletii]